MLDESFAVACVAAGVHHPDQLGPFDDPAAGQNDEPGGDLGAGGCLDSEVPAPFRPGHEIVGIGGAGPDDCDLGVHEAEVEGDFLRLWPSCGVRRV